MVASFHCCRTSPPFHTSTRMAWKRSRTMDLSGSSILSSSATRESGPGAFQLCIPRDGTDVFDFKQAGEKKRKGGEEKGKERVFDFK